VCKSEPLPFCTRPKKRKKTARTGGAAYCLFSAARVFAYNRCFSVTSSECSTGTLSLVTGKNGRWRSHLRHEGSCVPFHARQLGQYHIELTSFIVVLVREFLFSPVFARGVLCVELPPAHGTLIPRSSGRIKTFECVLIIRFRHEGIVFSHKTDSIPPTTDDRISCI